MKIFGVEFKTKKELKAEVAQLEGKLGFVEATFPFALGQTVYDVQLRNQNGKYTKKNASLEHSLINEVVVDKKNYFGLVERYNKYDVFTNYESAKEHLESICVNK